MKRGLNPKIALVAIILNAVVRNTIRPYIFGELSNFMRFVSSAVTLVTTYFIVELLLRLRNKLREQKR